MDGASSAFMASEEAVTKLSQEAVKKVEEAMKKVEQAVTKEDKAKAFEEALITGNEGEGGRQPEGKVTMSCVVSSSVSRTAYLSDRYAIASSDCLSDMHLRGRTISANDGMHRVFCRSVSHSVCRTVCMSGGWI